MRDNERQSAIILSVIGIVPVVWLALLIAPSVKGGLPEILPSLMNVFNNPFHIEVCEDSVKTVLILLLCYGMGIGIYFSTQRNYRRREEHGYPARLRYRAGRTFFEVPRPVPESKRFSYSCRRYHHYFRKRNSYSYHRLRSNSYHGAYSAKRVCSHFYKEVRMNER